MNEIGREIEGEGEKRKVNNYLAYLTRYAERTNERTNKKKERKRHKDKINQWIDEKGT